MHGAAPSKEAPTPAATASRSRAEAPLLSVPGLLLFLPGAGSSLPARPPFNATEDPARKRLQVPAAPAAPPRFFPLVVWPRGVMGVVVLIMGVMAERGLMEGGEKGGGSNAAEEVSPMGFGFK